MKEFGLYTIKQKYIDEFSKIDASLEFLKNNRPFICIKVTAEKRNWLIPVASIDPSKSDYINKNNKYKDFSEADKKQAKHDRNLYARAIHIFRDITGLHADPKFLSVIEYYNAIPVKHKYCKKYKDAGKNHIIITDPKLKEVIKKALIVNIKAKKKGEQVGFIKAKINEGFINFKNYPKKSIEIGEALYKDHIALQKAEKERKAHAEQRGADVARKKELKNVAKGISTQKVEIDALLVYKKTDKAVLVKIPGAKLDEKTAIWLPNDGIMLDRERCKVIGVREDLQKKYSLKMPQGQPKRFLK